MPSIFVMMEIRSHICHESSWHNSLVLACVSVCVCLHVWTATTKRYVFMCCNEINSIIIITVSKIPKHVLNYNVQWGIFSFLLLCLKLYLVITSPALVHPFGLSPLNTPPKKEQSLTPNGTHRMVGGGMQVITITSWRVSEDTLVQNRRGQEGGRPGWQRRPSLFQ